MNRYLVKFGSWKLTMGLVILAALLALLSPIESKAEVVFSDSNYNHKTYTAQLYGITPATTATDVVTLTGATGKVIRISKIEVSASATGASIMDFFVYKRTALDTGGTATNEIPTQHDSLYPLQPTVTNSGFVVGQAYVISATSTACNTIGAADNTVGTNFIATDVTASTCIATKSAYAKVKKYSANPTALGYGLLLKSDRYTLPASTTTGFAGVPWSVDFGANGGQQVSLRGSNESISFNLGGQAIPAGMSVQVSITWQED